MISGSALGYADSAPRLRFAGVAPLGFLNESLG
jgi:hypothetical protein